MMLFADRSDPVLACARAPFVLGHPCCQRQRPDVRYSFDWHDSRHAGSGRVRDPVYTNPFAVFLNTSHGPPWLPQIDTSERATPSTPSLFSLRMHRKRIVSFGPWMK